MLANAQIFCPSCATENSVDQSYCRQCGLGLTGIQWVLDGTIVDAQKRLQSAEKWIRAGNSILIAFISIAVTIAILGIAIGNPSLSLIAMVNVLGGAVIAFPLSLLGNSRLTKAKRLLSEAGVNPRSAIKDTERKQLPGIPTSSLQPSPRPGSVTEHTTLHLTRPDPAVDKN